MVVILKKKIYPKLSPKYPNLSQIIPNSGISGRNAGRNFCPIPVNPVPAGFENCISGAPLYDTSVTANMNLIGERFF